MNYMDYITPMTDKINLFLGVFVAFLGYIFGKNWILFIGFLGLNIFDFISRWIAAYLTHTESSEKGLKGIVKKVGYWLLIALSFGLGLLFVYMGNSIGVNLSFATSIGWFVLATLSINEVRSILENLVDAGYHIPKILISGLEVASKAIDGKNPFEDEEKDSNSQ